MTAFVHIIWSKHSGNFIDRLYLLLKVIVVMKTTFLFDIKNRYRLQSPFIN